MSRQGKTAGQRLGKPRDSREQAAVTGRFEQDFDALKEMLAGSADFVVRLIRTKDHKRVGIFFFTDLIDQQVLNPDIIAPLQNYKGPLSAKIITERLISAANIETEKQLAKICTKLTAGFAALLVEGAAEAILVCLQKYAVRGIERSESEDGIIGPHQSFGEDLGQNLSLLRRYVRSPHLKIKTFALGRISQTATAVIYLEKTAGEGLVAEVERRLGTVDLDCVLGASYLTEFLEDHPLTVLPQIKLTERPDRVVGALNEGRAAIIAEGDPTCLVVPFFVPETLQSAEDYYEKPLVATFLRWLRLISSGLGLFLPGLWITLSSFHHGIIPPKLFNSIVAGRENVPLPTVLEAFLLLFAFDIVIEASTRLPSAVGQAIGIVGAIILGQSAVQANLISPSMTIITALAGLAAFTQPSPNMVGPIRVLKYLVLITASIFGLFGMIWALIFFTVSAVSTSSFGYPSLFPIAPFDLRGSFDILLKLPNTWLKSHPRFLITRNNKKEAGHRDS